ncbi:glycerol dehydratase reactivase beta/small subunit family protein [Clostridium chrysemydis]|uniref:glycerol dehydratase reactivase beta/small subunit family protein n=1 Tax=Clostridium chrysemydis TaxID=2665504 RepID=UPI0018833E73|nr:glycerol dehydratase reactivase beta/small subunit family protein [Clostridium chrysemydis]
MKKDYSAPSIMVFLNEKVEEETILEVLYGIEEEGIPFALKKEIDDDSKKLAHLASNRSKLSVGIGIDSKGNISLTTDKLKEDSPLFINSLKNGESTLRSLGANGARLVKGMPLKNL